MLDKLITRSTLKNLAWAMAFQRGKDYFSAGMVDQLRDTGNKISARVEGYAEAIKLIRKAGGLMIARKQHHEFGAYLAGLRARFKPKRNFIKLLDEVANQALLTLA